MNNITKYVLRNMVTNESWDLMNHNNIKVIRNHVFEYKSNDIAYPVENGVYYSKTEIMQPVVIEMTAHLNKTNDFTFKRFINNHANTFRLDLTINNKNVYVFGSMGDQTSEINWGVNKEYKFTFNIETRPFTMLGWGAGVATFGVPGQYDVAEYNNSSYGSLGEVPTDYINAIFNGHNDVNNYFSITGKGTGGPVEIKVNQQVILINTVALNIDFYYSNIPARQALTINNANAVDVLDAANISNFTFDLSKTQNNITIDGLSNPQLTVWQGYKVI